MQEVTLRFFFLVIGTASILVGLFLDPLGIIDKAGWETPRFAFRVIQYAIVFMGAFLIILGMFYTFCLYFFQKVGRHSGSQKLLNLGGDRKCTPETWSILFIFCVTIIFYVDKIFLGVDAPIRLHDTFDSAFPRMLVEANLLLEYGFFGWYPNLSGGVPVFATHYAPYYPAALLATFVPLWLIYSAKVLIFMALAGIGMYLFLLRLMSLPNWVSLFGGILFCFNTQIQSNATIHQGFIFLFPLFVVATSGKLFRETSPFRVVASVFVGLGILSISLVTLSLTVWSFIHLSVMLLLKGKTKRQCFRVFMIVFTIWSSYAIINLPIIYTLLDFAEHYSRDYKLTAAYWPYELLSTVVLRDGFMIISKAGGVPLLLLAILLMKNSPEIMKFMGLAVLLLFLSSLFGSEFNSQIEILEKMDLRGFFYGAPFCLTVVLSLVVFECQSKRVSEAKLASMIIISAGFIVFWLYSGVPIFSKAATGYGLALVNTLVTTTIIVIVLIKRYRGDDNREIDKSRLKTIALSLIIGISVLFTAGSFRLERQTNENDDYLPLYGETDLAEYIHSGVPPYRVATLDERDYRFFERRTVGPSFVLMSEGEAVDGRSIAFFSNYKDIFELVIEGQFTSEDDRNAFRAYFYDLYLGSDVGKLNTALLRMMNLKYIVSQKKFPPLADWSLVTTVDLGKPLNRRLSTDSSLYLYELTDTFQRGYLVPEARVVASDQIVLDALAEETVEGFRSRVYLVDESSNGKIQYQTEPLSIPHSAVGQINLENYQPDKIVFLVENNHPVFVVVTNNYHPKWRAKLDGKEVPVLRANHTFQAIYIEENGKHEIVFEFIDPVLWWMHIGLIVGVMLFAVSVVWGNRTFNGTQPNVKVS